MFDSLTEKLQGAFASLRSKGRLSEQDDKDGLREVRVALLEADVSLDVVKSFIKTIKEKYGHTALRSKCAINREYYNTALR